MTQLLIYLAIGGLSLAGIRYRETRSVEGLLAEGTALIIQAYYARKYVKLSGILKTIRNTTLGSIAIVICCVLLSEVHLLAARIVADIVISAITYLVILMLLKEEGIEFLLRWTRQRKGEEK